MRNDRELEKLEKDVLALLKAETLLSQVGWDQIAWVKSNVHHGEYGVAIEDLCASLFEAPGPFDSDWVAALEKVALTLKLGDEYLGIIRGLARK
jgi:hypothetical protein